MATDANRARGLVGPRRPAAGALATAWADWRPSVLLAARALLVTRVVLWLVAIAAVEIAGISARAADFDPEGLTRPYGELGNLLLAPAARWDSVWFLSIAHDGYSDAARTAFFPLYPLLARGVVGGLLLSFAASLIGLAALHRLGQIELGEPAARAAVWLIACFPASFFLTAVYSEGLFLALSVGALLAARRERWVWAAVFGCLAAATRSAGIVLLVPLVMVWWTQRPRRGRDAAWLALVPLGLAAYCAGLAIAGLDGLAPFHAQDVWFRSFAGPFAGAWDGAVAAFDGARQLLSGSRTPVYFARAGGDPYINAAHNLELFAALVAAVPALIGVWRRLPPAYGAYVVVALALPLSWPVEPQPLMSLPRFELALFPLFLWLGWWAVRGRRRLLVLCGLMFALQALAVSEFATWHWFA
ncbi:MAG TPA: mannosyltransferase family protein [Solirubrobacteraceae bacterium]|nr:mannosyltransferase family protein [Solirubrobacteraceae bacterium]